MWTLCTPDHMESELILFQLHYSQMRDCRCQCEKPEPQSGCNKAIDLLQTFKMKGGKVIQFWDQSHSFVTGGVGDGGLRGLI